MWPVVTMSNEETAARTPICFVSCRWMGGKGTCSKSSYSSNRQKAFYIMIISWGGMGKYKERWEVGYKCEDWQVIYGRGGRKTRGRWGRERRFEHWWWGEGAEKVGNGIVNEFFHLFLQNFYLARPEQRERERDSLPLSLYLLFLFGTFPLPY